MPLISNPIVFVDDDTAMIEAATGQEGFNHNDWGSEGLLPLRQKIRLHYRQQQVGICAYCKGTISLVSVANAHIEHIVPKSLCVHFMFEPKNLCVVCADCNEIKRNQEVLHETPDPLKRKYKVSAAPTTPCQPNRF